jgi:glutathione S-transferase
MKLYGFPLSGHAHRAQLLLELLNLPYDYVTVDLKNGTQRAPAFLAMNPLGEVPVLDDDGEIVADSTAILVYLATKYDPSGRWLPRDPIGAATVQRWLSMASGKIAIGPAAARLVTLFGAQLDYERTLAVAKRLFDALEPELAGRRFALGDQPSIADVAGYSYIAHAPEGGVSLKPYPNIRAWLDNVRALPGFVGMPASNVGLAPETD